VQKCKCHAFKRRRSRPIIITTSILDYKDGHYVRPNRVALKYPDFKKDVDLNAHVKVCNFIVKANAKSSK
jgi:hypothetical protein